MLMKSMQKGKKIESNISEEFTRSAAEFMKEKRVERVKTGVKGLDELIDGGIPRNSLVLVSGSTGTGKTTLGMQFLLQGILEGEKGVFISLEEPQEKTIMQMEAMGWPIKKFVERNLLIITQPELYDFDKLLTFIEDIVTKNNAKRLVIDSISLISLYFQEDFKIRRAILELERMLKKLDCTTLAISEVKENVDSFSLFGVEEFVVDGIIVLYYLRKETIFTRAIAIRKMRATEHSLKIHPIKIKSIEGIVVYPEEEIFTEF